MKKIRYIYNNASFLPIKPPIPDVAKVTVFDKGGFDVVVVAVDIFNRLLWFLPNNENTHLKIFFRILNDWKKGSKMQFKL